MYTGVTWVALWELEFKELALKVGPCLLVLRRVTSSALSLTQGSRVFYQDL